MTSDYVRSILAALSGFWPTPALSEEETIAYTTELTGPARLTTEEAMHVIRGAAENGDTWRPRPGQIVALVQDYRRQEALRRPRPALPAGGYCSAEENIAQIRRCRELLRSGQAAS